MRRGDLTVRVDPATKPITARSEDPETQELIDLFNVHPATTPLVAASGNQLGELGETFNVMLGKAQGGLEAYNGTRESVARLITEIGDTAVRVSGASQEMSATTAETGAAIENIARLSEDVAAGASRQIQSIDAAQEINREAEALAGRGLSEGITHVSACIERMSSATGDVGQIARHAGEATADVSAATQQSSAATQQISASSSDLAALATSLQGLVETFRV